MALVLNRGLKIIWFSTSQVTPLTMALTGSGQSRTVTFQTLAALRYRIDAWLCDTNDPNNRTNTPPSESGASERTVITDATGAASITWTHSGPKTWWLFAEIRGRVSDGLEIIHT